jgi:uncharacterized surface protein with fasciclin (FAS1) repeats
MKTMFAVAACVLAAPAVAVAKDCPVERRAAFTAAAMTERGDIVDVAAGAGQFGTLLAAAQAAGLVDILQARGPLTVFAPTDAAFDALRPGAVQRLLRPENRAELRRVLSYHVIEGRVLAADLDGRTVRPRTLAGARLSVDGRQGVSVNNARVITADLAADNGVIHVIDRVLLPPH